MCTRAIARRRCFFDKSQHLTTTPTIPSKLHLHVHALGGVPFLFVFWCSVSHNSWEEANRNMARQHQKRRRLAMAGLHDPVVGLTESFQSLSLPCLDPKTADADVGTDTGGLTFHGAYQRGLRVSLDHTSWRLVRLVTRGFPLWTLASGEVTWIKARGWPTVELKLLSRHPKILEQA